MLLSSGPLARVSLSLALQPLASRGAAPAFSRGRHEAGAAPPGLPGVSLATSLGRSGLDLPGIDRERDRPSEPMKNHHHIGSAPRTCSGVRRFRAPTRCTRCTRARRRRPRGCTARSGSPRGGWCRGSPCRTRTAGTRGPWLPRGASTIGAPLSPASSWAHLGTNRAAYSGGGFSRSSTQRSGRSRAAASCRARSAANGSRAGAAGGGAPIFATSSRAACTVRRVS